jgi:hypothetical protein
MFAQIAHIHLKYITIHEENGFWCMVPVSAQSSGLMAPYYAVRFIQFAAGSVGQGISVTRAATSHHKPSTAFLSS